MKDFTIVVPIRNTEYEYNFMIRTLPSAFNLEPEEIIIGLDPNSERIKERALLLATKYSYNGSLEFIEPQIDRSWKFRLAHLTYEMYKAASNDIILHYDIDNILLKRVLRGLDYIKKDYTICVSFTKRFLIKNLQDLVRYAGYRINVYYNELSFAALYYIYRPYFFDLIDINEYKDISNGIDSYLVHKILNNEKYKLITLKEIGCKCLTYQNEDYPWRQFQYGFWFGSNFDRLRDERFNRYKKRANYYSHGLRYKLSNIALRIKTRPYIHILIYSLIYQRWHALYGFKFALKNQDNYAVKIAKQMELIEWINKGSEFFTYLPPEINRKYLPKTNEMTGFAR
ncbi:MAG: hypothetical protein QXK74_01265 [Candidatus Nitrosocaldaceae archaeon]